MGPAAVVAVALWLTACQPASPSLLTEYKTTIVGKLTPDGSDAFAFTSTTQGMRVRGASANTGSNLRMVGFKKAWPAATDQQSCITWASGNDGNAQPGVALRIDARADRVRSIIITNNILYGARWGFNVHLGDSGGSPQLTKVGSFTIDWSATPLPWTICGRVQGRTLTAKAWPSTIAEPAWGDPAFGTTVELPTSWVYSGRPGFYVGHLTADQVLEYSVIGGQALTGSTTTTSTTTTAPATTTTAPPATTTSVAPTTSTTTSAVPPPDPASPVELVGA